MLNYKFVVNLNRYGIFFNKSDAYQIFNIEIQVFTVIEFVWSTFEDEVSYNNQAKITGRPEEVRILWKSYSNNLSKRELSRQIFCEQIIKFSNHFSELSSSRKNKHYQNFLFKMHSAFLLYKFSKYQRYFNHEDIVSIVKYGVLKYKEIIIHCKELDGFDQKEWFLIPTILRYCRIRQNVYIGLMKSMDDKIEKNWFSKNITRGIKQ